MALEHRYLLMEINIRESIEEENSMEKENTHGPMDLHLKAIFVKE